MIYFCILDQYYTLFENALQTQILSKYTSRPSLYGGSGVRVSARFIVVPVRCHMPSLWDIACVIEAAGKVWANAVL